ncbi:hypothetical protein ACLOJK_036708 [Asimina triloba]
MGMTGARLARGQGGRMQMGFAYCRRQQLDLAGEDGGAASWAMADGGWIYGQMDADRWRDEDDRGDG